MKKQAADAATSVEGVDLAVAKQAAPLAATPAVRILGAISELADQPQLNTICAVTFLAGIVTRNSRLADAGGRMVAAQLLSTTIKSIIKHRVDRTRPRVVDQPGDYRMKPGSNPDGDVSSFPSGHTAGAVAVARALSRRYRFAGGTALGGAALVAAIQVPRRQHFMTDLVAGAAVGLIAEGLVATLARRLSASAS